MQRENAWTDSTPSQFTGKGIFQSPNAPDVAFAHWYFSREQGALLRGFQGEDNKSFLLDTAEMWDCSESGGPRSEQ